MKTIIVNIDNELNAKTLSEFLKSLHYVRSVEFTGEIETEPGTIAEEDWVKPGRPASDEEFEALIRTSEMGENITAEVSKNQNLKKLKEWAMKNSE